MHAMSAPHPLQRVTEAGVDAMLLDAPIDRLTARLERRFETR